MAMYVEPPWCCACTPMQKYISRRGSTAAYDYSEMGAPFSPAPYSPAPYSPSPHSPGIKARYTEASTHAGRMSQMKSPSPALNTPAHLEILHNCLGTPGRARTRNKERVTAHAAITVPQGVQQGASGIRRDCIHMQNPSHVLKVPCRVTCSLSDV